MANSILEEILKTVFGTNWLIPVVIEGRRGQIISYRVCKYVILSSK